MVGWFLAVSALVWLPYGVFCFLDPHFLSEAAGIASSSPTGTIELRAMYGGLQASLGALAGAACFRASLRRPALLALAFACGGLFTARLLGALLSGSFSSYTVAGLLSELVSVMVALGLLRSDRAIPAPASG